MQSLSFKFLSVLICALTIVCFSSAVSAQKRDNLTDEEDMQVREAQEIDLRMKVFSKVIDRRLSAIGNPNAAEFKQSQKDVNNDWGALRTGTNAELFWDIEKTLDESIRKIDDVAERDQKNPLFGRAVHILADNCKNWIPQFKGFGEKSADEKERNAIVNSINSCNQIIEASGKVSKEVPKEEKKKKKNSTQSYRFFIRGYCIAAAPKLNEINEKYKGKDFKLVAINASDTKDIIQKFEKNNQTRFEILYGGEETANSYGIDGFPMIVLIDKSGKVIYSGVFNPNKTVQLEKLIDKNL